MWAWVLFSDTSLPAYYQFKVLAAVGVRTWGALKRMRVFLAAFSVRVFLAAFAVAPSPYYLLSPSDFAPLLGTDFAWAISDGGGSLPLFDVRLAPARN